MTKQMIRKKTRENHWKLIAFCLMVADGLSSILSYGFALWARFDFLLDSIPSEYLENLFFYIPFNIATTILVFLLFRLYKRVWRFMGAHDLVDCVAANIFCAIIDSFLITVLRGRMPISYYIIGFVFQTILTTCYRFSYRLFLMLHRRQSSLVSNRIMIVGAGEAGQAVARDIIRNRAATDKVCCFIDDNPNKTGRLLFGIPIVGTRDDLLLAVKTHKIDSIIFAIPSANAVTRRDILSICNASGCILQQVSPAYVKAGIQITYDKVSQVNIEDLLGRKPIHIQSKEVFTFVQGKCILVTGGGGSIGSELCRQLAAHHPRRLIIFDIYENNAYAIQLELKDKYPGLELVTLIGSVRDSRRLEQVFRDHRPDLVFHAAAHKHVPLMEDSPCESIKNNVFGTFKTACMAIKYGVDRFILVSTDKAVNPTNIMGASKRLCEMVVQSLDKMCEENRTGQIPSERVHSKIFSPENARTEFVAVRFGNVLGSNGSVVPLFKQQIEKGGPVTVTHPDIIRFFMTIPEAVSLILQAGANASGGEIYVLDMGDPVKIDDLARNLIRLSGLLPDEDIKIEYTGLRPGEKLYEEKLMEEEGLKKTANDLIFVARPLDFDPDAFLSHLEELYDAANENSDAIRETVMRLVPSYHPAENCTRLLQTADK